MVRCFLDGAADLQDALAPLGNHQTWVTGTLFAPQLAAFARAFSRKTGVRADVLPVANRFFGETVTVAGLLTVDDIVNTLTGRDVGNAIVIPEAIFRGPEGHSLDGAAPETIQTTAGCPTYLVSQAVSGAWTVAPLSG
jgi:NifB/MoaA-like Fe-S oxidoreductase